MRRLDKNILTWFFTFAILSCGKSPEGNKTGQPQREKSPEGETADQERVRMLAQATCSSCHAFVEPDRLPKSAWKEILPIMGYFIGKAEEGYIMKDEEIPGVTERLKGSFVFARKSGITDEEWGTIQRYFEDNAPEELAKPDQPHSSGVPRFSYEPHPWKGPSMGVTFLKHEGGMLRVGSSSKDGHALLALSKEGKVIRSHASDTPVVDVIPVVDSTRNTQMDLVLQMGAMENVDVPTGRIATLTDGMRTVVEPLQRPVDFVLDDFNGDGRPEMLVAEFGKYLGGIYIYHQEESLVRHTVFGLPGATQFQVKDVNRDGLMDFYCLVSQWDESIYLFTNKGGFSFEIKRLLNLPPYSGLVHFELIDFDGDGDEDIICSNGDSGDFTPFYKPFHGVRIFENRGGEGFVEKWFFSQQGSYGTVCHDFDGDGDIDFGSIGHLASWFGEDETGFIYFENISTPSKPWSFQAHSLTGVPDNCWVLIESIDVDQDGDMDIILGANTTFVTPEIAARNLKAWAKHGGVISILRNNLR
jgi:hypothetical protein